MEAVHNIHQNSLFAFSYVQPKLNDRQREVYNAMRMYNRPFTDKDLARFMNLERNFITPRRGELYKKGLIQPMGNTVQDGRKAQLWSVGIL